MTNQNFLKKIRLRKVSKHEESEFYKTLFKIGYFPEAKSKFDKKMIINSFQRHFRQKLVNGKIDQECLFIAKKLVK